MLKVDINSDRSENVKYDYPDFPVYIRKALLSLYPNYAAESHWHDDIELIAVLSGHMMYNVNGEIVRIDKGEGIFVNARQLHYGFSDDMTECEFICILFHPLVLCNSKMFDEKYVSPLIHFGRPYILFSEGGSWQDKAVYYMREIYNRSSDVGAPLIVQGNLHLLWSGIVANTDMGLLKGQRDSRLSTLKEMIEFIYNNYSEKIILEDIAAAGHISKRSCGNIFLRYLNQTPIYFLTDYRLRKSIELMKTTDKTILEISIDVGFSGASYYAEAFRKHFGKSPVQYRKQL